MGLFHQYISQSLSPIGGVNNDTTDYRPFIFTRGKDSSIRTELLLYCPNQMERALVKSICVEICTLLLNNKDLLSQFDNTVEFKYRQLLET